LKDQDIKPASSKIKSEEKTGGGSHSYGCSGRVQGKAARAVDRLSKKKNQRTLGGKCDVTIPQKAAQSIKGRLE